MAQFDVFLNPVAAARSTYPFVMAMQADLAADAVYQMVAPIAARGPFTAGNRLTPKVEVKGKLHVVLVPHMTVLRSRDLTSNVASLAAARGELLAAIDLLFFGL
jgi:toxin CcdB